MMFDFILTISVDGETEKQAFKLSSRSIVIAVGDAYRAILRSKPTAVFSGLTYFHPPLD